MASFRLSISINIASSEHQFSLSVDVPNTAPLTTMTLTPAEVLDRELAEFTAQAGAADRTVKVSKSSVEALEVVMIDRDQDSRCTICLEDLAGDDEDDDDDDDRDRTAVEMPCSHVFHRDCIVEWFEKSHLCPLCRYAMPTSPGFV